MHPEIKTNDVISIYIEKLREAQRYFYVIKAAPFHVINVHVVYVHFLSLIHI